MLLVKTIAALLVSHAVLVPLSEVVAQSQSMSQTPRVESLSPIVFKDLPETQEIATTLQTPIAVRGSVLILPIVRRNSQVAWPASMILRLEDGRRITGRTAQIESHELQRSEWESPKQVTGTTEPKGDEDVVLLVPLPTDGADEIYLADQKINPIWMDGLSMPLVASRTDLSLNDADLPDPAAPSEYFRAILQAYRMGITPPPPVGGEIDVLYARAIAGLWSAAIARLEMNDAVISKNFSAILRGVLMV